jgi:hypothetical protein
LSQEKGIWHAGELKYFDQSMQNWGCLNFWIPRWAKSNLISIVYIWKWLDNGYTSISSRFYPFPLRKRS